MPKKAKLNPLRNPGTSKVFYAIVMGVPLEEVPKILAGKRRVRRTPSEVSKVVKVKPPGVMEQIRRLEKFGVVKKGEKIGRSQYYDIEWEKVDRLFIDRILGTIPEEWVPETKKWVPVPGVKRVKESREKMLKNKYFGFTVVTYLTFLAPDAIRMKMTVDMAIDNFARDIVWIFPHLKPKVKDRAAREFLSELEKWYEWHGSPSIPTMDSIMDAFRALDFM
jgi:DNA-binding Lrp family transcriptional regulator